MATAAAQQVVTVPLVEYNTLYEKAYLNEERMKLDAERRKLMEAKEAQDEALRLKMAHLEESKSRREREQRGAVSSRNWLLLKHSVEGSLAEDAPQADGNMAVFKSVLEFRVFEDEWTVIPVADAQLITDDWKVSRADGADNDWSLVTSMPDTLLLVQELDESPPRQVLATNKAGLYRVEFSVYILVHSNRNLNSFSLNLLYPITSTTLRLPREAGQTKVRELNVIPAARCTVAEENGAVNISIRVPPTRTMEVKWRGIDASEAEKAAAEKADEAVQVTACHDALHEIGDGILQSSHTIKYTLDSEQTTLTRVQIAVQGAVRVTSVTGYGVLSWKASGSSDTACVEVFFKSSMISDTIILVMTTEMELPAGDVTLPVLSCEGVLRQTGSLGVVKAANVEVHEQQTRAMTRVSIDELPEPLKYQTNRPIMFAYRYVSVPSHVKLAVIKHEQVGVLDAVVDSAYYQRLVVDTQSMHRLLLTVQNSSQQYLALQGVPLDARLWGLMVNSTPAKPVRGKHGELLIPLLVGTASDSNQGSHNTSVELAYLTQHPTLGEQGSLQLDPPRMGLPISTFLMEVQLPEEYKVEFSGPMRKVRNFSYPVPKPVNYEKGTDIVPHGFNFNSMAQEVKRTGISVQVPKAGNLHRFERLLVVDEGAEMTAAYSTPTNAEAQPSTWSKLKTLLPCDRRSRK
mmetsp:Transcript_85459/g.151113  ORF Transcript_85459/g.151113 Transcript_85459/m.151113 type:complete len:687 (+) Transcript_85459:57-2117(+)